MCTFRLMRSLHLLCVLIDVFYSFVLFFSFLLKKMRVYSSEASVDALVSMLFERVPVEKSHCYRSIGHWRGPDLVPIELAARVHLFVLAQ